MQGLPGNAFLSGLAFHVSSQGLPGGINPVSWSDTVITDTTGVNVTWQWAASSHPLERLNYLCEGAADYSCCFTKFPFGSTSNRESLPFALTNTS